MSLILLYLENFVVKKQSIASLSAITIILFTIGFAPYLAQDTFAELEPILDTAPPDVIIPSDMTLDGGTADYVILDYSAKAIDDVDGVITPTCNLGSGTVFAVVQSAAFVVTCTATDSAGNTGSASFILAITSSSDSSLPLVTVPGDMTITAGTTGYAILEYSVTAIDDVDGVITPTCNLSSGFPASVGEWPVACTATDSAGNIGYNRFMVTVIPGSDTTPEPVIDVTEEVEHDPVPTPDLPPPAPAEIDIKFDIGSSVPGCELSNSCFNPSLLFVDAGETITWYNADTATHTVTSGTPTGGPDGNFDSSSIIPGSTFSVTLTQPGTYTYFSMMHPWAIGEIIVQDSGTSGSDITPTDVIVPSDMTIDAQSAENIKSNISASTDKTFYQKGDSVIFSGKVTNYEFGKTVSYVMDDPNGYHISMSQTIIPNSDGIFSHTFESDWSLWRLDGNYEINYHYSDDLSTKSQLTYYYSIPAPAELTPESTPEPVIEPTPEPVIEPTPEAEHKPESTPLTETNSVITDKKYDSKENPSTSIAQNLIKQDGKNIDVISKQLDSQTQSKVKSLDSKILREQSQYDEYYKQYQYYEGKTLSSSDEQKFQRVIEKLNSQNEKISSLTDERNIVVLQSDDLSELIGENKKLREELERQGEQIDDLNKEVDLLKQIIQSIQGFFSSVFG